MLSGDNVDAQQRYRWQRRAVHDAEVAARHTLRDNRILLTRNDVYRLIMTLDVALAQKGAKCVYTVAVA